MGKYDDRHGNIDEHPGDGRQWLQRFPGRGSLGGDTDEYKYEHADACSYGEIYGYADADKHGYVDEYSYRYADAEDLRLESDRHGFVDDGHELDADANSSE